MSNDKVKIKQQDMEKVVEFLNFAADHTVLKEINWQDSIKFVELLTYMQQVILPKMKHAAEQKQETPIRVKAEPMGPEKSKEYKEETKDEPKTKAKVVRKKKKVVKKDA